MKFYHMALAGYDLVTVLGPTASGKTAFAAQLAFRIDGEVISADSRQVYRNMNIGTGKDYLDYRVGESQVPVHLIDIAEPGYKYSLFEYQRDFLKTFDDIVSRSKFPILCGGSGMYINAATRKYRLDEVPFNEKLRTEMASKSLEELSDLLATLKSLHNKTDTDNVEHAIRAIEIELFYQANPVGRNVIPDLRVLYIGICYDRETERKRITERLQKRLEQGLVDEVRGLLISGISADILTYYGLEYRYITLYLLGKIDYGTMVSQLNIAIHQFAKRQRTWFRKMEREGCPVNWMEGSLPMEEKVGIALRLINT
jgi:tRNA dimethylallyltransferase